MAAKALLASLFGLLLAGAAHGQTSLSDDAWINGSLSIGTTIQGARLEVKAGSTTAIPFSAFSQASASDPFPALQVDNSGRVGFGIAPSTYSHVDIWGVGDVGDIGLQLRFGNRYPSLSGLRQIAFGQNGTSNYRHTIDSVHLSSTARNSIDFRIWTPSAGIAAALPVLHVMSIVTTSSPSIAGVQAMPNDAEPNALDAQLEISDGVTTGGGTLHRLSESTPSSRDLKADIRYLTGDDEKRALEDLLSLKHSRYRYKVWKKHKLVADKKAPLVRGLIYEETPESIRGAGKTLIIQQRVENLEMGMRELMREIDEALADAQRLK